MFRVSSIPESAPDCGGEKILAFRFKASQVSRERIMQRIRITVGMLALLAGVAQADVYTDAIDDIDGNIVGADILNISQVEVTNDANYIYFSISVTGDLDAANWGKYAIGMDTGRNAGDNSNPWGRNVDWGRGITDFAGSWADDGGSGVGAELYAWNGGWGLTDATYAAGTDILGDDTDHASGIQRIAISLAALGLSNGDVLAFDVFSTGGNVGDAGIDMLSRSDASTDWWTNQSLSGELLSYTVQVVPLPSSAMAGLLGLGGVAVFKRLRR